MNLLTALDRKADYSKTQLQFIVAAWVMSTLLEKKKHISLKDGDVSEDDYEKTSIYSLLYAIYHAMGEVPSATGEMYEFTFNTWGYAWPKAWGPCPNKPSDPQLYGENAYAGLFHFDEAKRYVEEREGKVHVVEMGCGTGAGANEICSNVLPKCTYEAVDMQAAAIQTCRRKFVPHLGGRLVATCADATLLTIGDGVADFIAVNETHVTEHPGQCTDEDQRFFRTAFRLLKPGGFLVWGNAIPDSTWKPCFEFLESIGMKLEEECDVTKEAVQARDEDRVRIDRYVARCLDTFLGLRIPFVGEKRRREADWALKNFSRNPGTRLYENMVDGTDSYKVVLLKKVDSGSRAQSRPG
jgi:SAM-dependent methyltransferase